KSAVLGLADRWTSGFDPAYLNLVFRRGDLPCDLKRAHFSRQCAMFRSVGRELVDRHPETNGGLGAQGDIRPPDQHFADAILVWCGLVANDGFERNTGPVGLGQPSMRLR